MYATVQRQLCSATYTPPHASPTTTFRHSSLPLSLSLPVSLFVVLLLCFNSLIPLSPTVVVGQTTGLVGNGTSFNVAVIVNCVYGNYTDVTFPMQLPDDFDITLCTTGVGSRSNSDWFKGYETFRRTVAASGGIPVNGMNISLKVTYFNVGGINYLQPNSSGVMKQFQQAVKNTAILTQQLGLYGGYDYTTNRWGAPCRFCTIPYDNNPLLAPGFYGTRYPVVITPPYCDNLPQILNIPASITNTPFRACQLSKECIAIAHFAGFSDWIACKPVPKYVYAPNSTVPTVTMAIPDECTKAVDPSLPSDKRLGARRFDYGFSALPAQDGILRESIAWFKLRGVQTAILIITSQKDYISQVLEPGLAQLRSNNIQLLIPELYFPANGVYFTQDQINSIVDSVVTLDPDLFILLPHGTLQNDLKGSIGILRGLRDREYIPRALAIPGGSAGYLAATLSADANARGVWDPVLQQGAADGAYFFGTTYFDPQLRGYAYDAVNDLNPTHTNSGWEPFPSTADGTVLSPAVFTLTYCRMWNVSESMLTQGFVWPVLEAMPLVIATKLFYASGGSDLARDLQLASLSISVPSIGGMIQFDSFGRLVQNDQYVTQYGRTGNDYHLITPLDVGVPDVFPTPTYAERIPPNKGSASFLGTYQEHAVVAVTCVGNVYLLGLMAGVILTKQTPVMRASSPIFCLLMLCGGIICISSNYAHSLYATSSACGVYVWFLTVGFTLMFGSLHTKNLRTFRIYQSAKLRIVTVSNRELFALLFSLVAIDIIVNIIWSGWIGFPTEYVTVDIYRPRLDYIQCQFKDDARTKGLILFHLIAKTLMIFSGIILSFLGRNIPALYNESWYVAASMYNCTLLLCFLVPLVATQVGSRLATYLISSYGILLVVLSTASVLFVPKFVLLYQLKRKRSNTNAGKTAPSTHVPNLPFDPRASHLTAPRLTDHDLEQVVKLSTGSTLEANGVPQHVSFDSSPLAIQRSEVISRMNSSARDYRSASNANESIALGPFPSRALISAHLGESNLDDRLTAGSTPVPTDHHATTSDSSADSSRLPPLDGTSMGQMVSSVEASNKLNRPVPPTVVRMHTTIHDEGNSEQTQMWQKLCVDLQFQVVALKAETSSLREQLQDMYLLARASSSNTPANGVAGTTVANNSDDIVPTQMQSEIAASPTEADSLLSNEDVAIFPRFVEEHSREASRSDFSRHDHDRVFPHRDENPIESPNV